MTDAIIILALVVIGVIAVKHFLKKGTKGCCGSVDHKVKVADKKPSHYPYNVTVGISGMSCAYCKQRVENVLNEQEGVWARVDLEKKNAFIRIKKQLSEEELRGLIEKAGYEMTNIQ